MRVPAKAIRDYLRIVTEHLDEFPELANPDLPPTNEDMEPYLNAIDKMKSVAIENGDELMLRFSIEWLLCDHYANRTFLSDLGAWHYGYNPNEIGQEELAELLHLMFTRCWPEEQLSIPFESAIKVEFMPWTDEEWTLRKSLRDNPDL